MIVIGSLLSSSRAQATIYSSAFLSRSRSRKGYGSSLSKSWAMLSTRSSMVSCEISPAISISALYEPHSVYRCHHCVLDGALTWSHFDITDETKVGTNINIMEPPSFRNERP